MLQQFSEKLPVHTEQVQEQPDLPAVDDFPAKIPRRIFPPAPPQLPQIQEEQQEEQRQHHFP